MLLCHHLFFTPSDGYDDWFVAGYPFWHSLAIVCKSTVALFLLLSGFGLYRSSQRNPLNTFEFYKKRLLRLYPTYFLVWLIFVPLTLIFTDHSLAAAFGDYISLKLIANLLGIASGAVQIRFSEALTILPYFTVSAVPGLTVGCLLANILTGCALPDIIFGTLATLLGAVFTRLLRKYKWLAPVPPILANALIIPPVLYFAYGVKPIWFSLVTVTAGEIISCGVLGMLLLFALQKYASVLFKD